MSLLNTDTKSDRAANRVFPVTVKLTREERGEVTRYAEGLGQARGKWMRDVILRELRRKPLPDSTLTEVLGIRLLLVNILRPLATGQKMTTDVFDELLDEIATAKRELATEIISEERK